VVYVLVAVVAAFFNPAISAAIPDLVPEARVSTANSLNQLSIQLAVFVGQGLGGVLFRLAGAPVLFLINGLTYLFASASESLITIPQVMQRAGGESKGRFREFGSDIQAGLRYIWSRPGLRELVFVSALLSFFTWPILVLLPFYVRDSLGATEDWFGYLSAAYGVGMLAGYLAAGAVPFTGKARGRLMVALIIAQSAGYGLLGLVREPIMALMLALVGGGMGGMVTVTITTIIQTTTPGEIRGRVFGLLSTISSSLAPLAMGLAGVVADLTGKNIPLIYVACGVIMGLLSVLVSLNRQFRDFLAFEQAGAVGQKVERQPASLR
jgi:MFS family permease